MTNVQKYTTAGLQVGHYGFRHASGYMIGAASTLANAGSSGMVPLDGIESISLQPQAGRIVNIGGNDGNVGSYIFPPDASPTGDLVLGTFNANAAALPLANKVWTDGDLDRVPIQPSDYDYKNMIIVTCSRAQSRDAATLGTNGFVVKEYCNVVLVPRFEASLQNATGANWTHQIIANQSTTLPDGRALSLANQGTTKAVGFQSWSPNLWTYHVFVRDGIATTFTLDHLPLAADAVKTRVTNNGTLLSYTTDYTVSTSTGVVTLAAVGTAGHIVVVGYQYSATN
jgi:hypothetical protein